MYDVSVIVPIYNGEKYLKKCLDSILSQSLKNIEIICIDDGSTDNTSKILKKYSSKDSRVKIISTENNGQGHGRNIALNEANGEYVAFVDADDWIKSNSLKMLHSKARNNNLDMLFFQMINYIEKSKNYVETELYNHQCFTNNGIDENTIFNSNDVYDFLFEIPVGPVSKLYKMEFLKSNELKFPEGIIFEDNAFFYNAFLKCNRAGFLKEQFYCRRRHENSVTQTLDESKFDIIKATNLVLDVFQENDKYDKYKPDIINHTFSMLIEWFEKAPLNLKQKFYTLIKSDFKGFNELKEDFGNNLTEEYLTIFNIACDNDYYLDFNSQYMISTADYTIYDKNQHYELGSEEYHEYKSNMTNSYKISVVIPIYNTKQFIHRTLMSIENQSIGIENIEVLMVDDLSAEDTHDILKEYCEKYDNFKLIRLKKRTESPGTPRNIGLIEASSNYITFLDHDDLLEINGLEILYETITQSDCDIVYGTYASIDKKSPTKIIYPNEKHGYFENIYENERSIAFPPPSIWTKLFKRDFLIKNNIQFPTILGEDAIFMSKALLKAEGINYLWDSLICLHDLNNESYTNNVSYRYLIEGFTSEEYLYRFYKDQNNEHFYRIRGENILDFYLRQFFKSKLTEKEIFDIFPSLYDFTKRIADYGLTPINENNVILFNLILKKDINQVIDFKRNYNKIPLKKKMKNKIKKVVKKIIR